MNKMNGETINITESNIEKLKQLFPEILSEGEKIDFDKLKTIMGESIENSTERYNFTWHGKKESILGAQKPSKGTLRPHKEKSKDFDTTENIYIEGDNLETLKLLQKSYNKKVKVIYIDPPYNTGNDFVYKDNFKDGVENYLEQTGQVDSDGNQLSTNSESQGRYHSNWLNMMYPRLKLARNLLTEDGAIFVSIDESEIVNLSKLMNEIFGEENLIQRIVWRRSDNQPNIGTAARVKEYILVYSKNKTKLKYGRLPLSDKAKKEYRYEDEYGKFRRGILLDKTRGRHIYEVVTKTGKVLTGPWMITEEKFKEMDANNLIYWTKSGKEQPYSKTYISESKGAIPNDFWGIEFGTNQRASIEVEKLFGKRYFDFPKPVSLIKNILSIGTDKDSIILDFFSGSATTAQAVMELNAEDKGKRKFIMVQLPEILGENSIAYKDGYRTICDIGEERIRRAGEKVTQELIGKDKELGLFDNNQVNPNNIDTGFKVFKLDKSNIKEWNIDFENIDQINLYEDMFVEGRTELDIVYEILLKNGVDLTYPVNNFEVNNKRIYDVAYGNLFICLADDIDSAISKAIAAKRREYEIETSSVVFKDAGFKGNDSEKLNVIEILKDAGYTDEQLLTI